MVACRALYLLSLGETIRATVCLDNIVPEELIRGYGEQWLRPS